MGLGLGDKWELFKLYRRKEKVIEKLKSRKLWAVVIGATVAALGNQLGLPDDTVSNIVQLISVYIIGQGAADTAAALKAKKDTKLPIAILGLWLALGSFATQGMAQDFAIQLGGVFQPSTQPKAASSLTFLVGPSYSTVNLYPVGASREIAYALRTGIERKLIHTPNADLFVCGQAGVLTSEDVTAGLFSGCTGLNIHPSFLRGLQFVPTFELQTSPASEGAVDFRLGAGFRYTFSTQ